MNRLVLDGSLIRWSSLTFGLHSQGHVVGRVVLLPKGPQTLVDVDLQLFGLLLQRLGVSCRTQESKTIQHSCFGKCRGRRGEEWGKKKKKKRRGKTWQLSQRCCLFSPDIPQGGLLRCVHCAVPAVVFTNSPQQNLPMGCPGLAKLPNSISFLWESDGLASWYSEEDEKEDKTWGGRREE